MPIHADATEPLSIRPVGDHHVEWTLRRDEARHALDKTLIEALLAAVSSLPDRVRTVLIKSDGPVFCAGADLRWMKASAALGPQAAKADAALLDQLFAAVAAAPQVMVVRVQGAAFGGGVGLCAAADLVVAATDAMFTLSEVHLGLVPATIAPYILARVSPAAARALMLTGEPIPAPHAANLGLVDKVVAPQSLDAAVEQCLRQLWRGGPKAQSSIKQLVGSLMTLPWLQQRSYALDMLDRVRRGEEAQEGMGAFFEKRAPTWRPQ